MILRKLSCKRTAKDNHLKKQCFRFRHLYLQNMAEMFSNNHLKMVLFWGLLFWMLQLLFFGMCGKIQ